MSTPEPDRLAELERHMGELGARLDELAAAPPRSERRRRAAAAAAGAEERVGEAAERAGLSDSDAERFAAAVGARLEEGVSTRVIAELRRMAEQELAERQAAEEELERLEPQQPTTEGGDDGAGEAGAGAGPAGAGGGEETPAAAPAHWTERRLFGG